MALIVKYHGKIPTSCLILDGRELKRVQPKMQDTVLWPGEGTFLSVYSTVKLSQDGSASVYAYISALFPPPILEHL
jgi:hypothetical protein